MKINALDLKNELVDVMRAKLVPFVTSDPGIGKSSIARQICDQYKLKLIDVRLAQCDPVDIGGLPTLKGDKFTYRPMDSFPIEGDKIPDGYNGFLLLLDEFNSAPRSVQSAAYRLVLDREIGQHKLHDKCLCMAAGNLETSRAIVNSIGTALQSRMIHFELMVDSNIWLDWASENQIDHRIISYIRFKPECLSMFNPEHSDKTFSCPRTWFFASKLLKGVDTISSSKLITLAGTLSEGVAREFNQFCEIYKDLPLVSDIIKNPTILPVPKEPGTLYALIGSIEQNTTESNIDNIMTYINRIPKEFQVVSLRGIIKRKSDLYNHTAIQNWIENNLDLV